MLFPEMEALSHSKTAVSAAKNTKNKLKPFRSPAVGSQNIRRGQLFYYDG